MQTLVSDHGSELTSGKTKELLLSKSIIHDFSAPFTPEQNGFIERGNRTVVEAVRSMLIHKNLPEYLWGEAANVAVYVLNRIVNKNTRPKTPYEIYFGSVPKVSHIRIFGSLALVKMQEKKRSGYQRKLEPRAMTTISVGYEKDFTYKCFNPVDKKFIVTREVIFDESKSYEWSGKEEHTYVSLDTFISNERTIESDDNMPVNESVISDHDVSFESARDDSLTEENMDEYTSEQVTNNGHSDLEVGLRRSARLANRENTSVIAEALLVYGDEPTTYEEAVISDDAPKWKEAMKQEYNSLIKNETWDLVQLPIDRKLITCKWIFKLKMKTDGSVEPASGLYKRGFSQIEGLDFKETFSPVARLDSIRLLLSIVANDDMDMLHFDIKTAFLHDNLSESIYMEQPKGFVKSGGFACKLRKSLYGLKQASREWNKCFVSFLKLFQLEPIAKDNCILVRKDDSGKAILIIAIYVDDGLACSSNKILLHEVVDHLKCKFEVTVMDPNCFVGLQIYRDRPKRLMLVNQQYYTEKIIKRFELHNSKPLSTPMETNQKFCKAGSCDGHEEKSVDVPYRQAIGSLIYVSNGTRLDISFAVSKLASYSDCAKTSHWTGVKRIFRYLKCTSGLGLYYRASNNAFVAYSDSDFAGDMDSKKSTSGILLMLNNAPIVWRSCKQTTVDTSTTNAEFVSASLASSDVIWVRQLMREMGRQLVTPTILHIDNQSAIKLIVNNQINTKIKHIDVKYMFVREACENLEIEVRYIETALQLADILTKSLAYKQYNFIKEKCGLLSLEDFNNQQ